MRAGGRGLGSALGLLIGALVLGSASAHALRALGGALATLWTDARVRSSVLGYLGHMWELYTLWVLVPLILPTRLQGAALSWMSFAVIGSGAIGCAVDAGRQRAGVFWLAAAVGHHGRRGFATTVHPHRAQRPCTGRGQRADAAQQPGFCPVHWQHPAVCAPGRNPATGHLAALAGAGPGAGGVGFMAPAARGAARRSGPLTRCAANVRGTCAGMTQTREPPEFSGRFMIAQGCAAPAKALSNSVVQLTSEV